MSIFIGICNQITSKNGKCTPWVWQFDINFFNFLLWMIMTICYFILSIKSYWLPTRFNWLLTFVSIVNVKISLQRIPAKLPQPSTTSTARKRWTFFFLFLLTRQIARHQLRKEPFWGKSSLKFRASPRQGSFTSKLANFGAFGFVSRGTKNRILTGFPPQIFFFKFWAKQPDRSRILLGFWGDLQTEENRFGFPTRRKF